jgi:hypothetical protein
MTDAANAERIPVAPASKRHTVAEWFGVLAGPLAMLANLEAQYALAPWACSTGARFVLHVWAAIFVAVGVGAAIVSWREWRLHAGDEPLDGGPAVRPRFFAIIGFGASVFFTLIMLLMWLASAFLDVCGGS